LKRGRGLETLEAETSKVRLKINEQKTKYMIAARNRTILAVGQTVAFGDRSFEVVNEFVYLGALVTPNNDVGLEIQRIIQTANNSPGTTDKVNDPQDVDPPGSVVRQ
jgi:hypothetical protein